MSDQTGIEWTDATWNPVTGCTEVSPGCDHCYAKTFAERWRGTEGHPFERSFDVQLRPDKLDLPLRWKKPRKVFVNSMSDLFHDAVPDEYIARVLAVIAACPQHTFQVLTKRHGRMRSLLRSDAFTEEVGFAWHEHLDGQNKALPWQPLPLSNLWLGVSVENQRWADLRIPALLDTPAAVRWLSAEPLLGPIDLSRWLHYRPIGANLAMEPMPPSMVRACGLTPLDWVVVGGESGHGARPMHPQWARSLRDQCQAAGVPFLFKQWGQFQPQNVKRYSELLRFSDPSRGCVVEPDGRISVAWTMSGRDLRDDGATSNGAPMLNVGKSRAGRALDGRLWDEYPNTSAPQGKETS